jgi:hypothetical protein
VDGVAGSGIGGGGITAPRLPSGDFQGDGFRSS